MSNKQLTITHTYHFLSEAILVFLIIHPFQHHHYEGVPYLVYVGVAGMASLAFSLYEHYQLKYTPYLVTLPFLVVTFIGIGYPVSLSILFAILLTWRYLAIRSELYIKREELYIVLCFVLVSGIVLFVKDFEVLLLFVALLFINIIGNIVSHLIVINKQDQKLFNRNFWVYFVAFFTVMSLVVYLTTDFARNIFLTVYSWIGDMLIFIASMLAGAAEYADIDLNPSKVETEEMVLEEEPPELESYFDVIGAVVGSYFGITLLLAVIFLLIIIFMFFRTRVKFRKAEKEEEVSYDLYEQPIAKQNQFSRKMFRKRKKKLEHPVRRMILEFEYTAAKHNKGRKPYETIEEWLKRIGFTNNLHTYQKVRYAHMDVKNDEVEQLVSHLQEMESKL